MGRVYIPVVTHDVSSVTMYSSDVYADRINSNQSYPFDRPGPQQYIRKVSDRSVCPVHESIGLIIVGAI